LFGFDCEHAGADELTHRADAGHISDVIKNETRPPFQTNHPGCSLLQIRESVQLLNLNPVTFECTDCFPCSGYDVGEGLCHA
jgi:hypothetical protein